MQLSIGCEKKSNEQNRVIDTGRVSHTILLRPLMAQTPRQLHVLRVCPLAPAMYHIEGGISHQFQPIVLGRSLERSDCFPGASLLPVLRSALVD